MDINSYGGWIVYANGEYLVAVAYLDTKFCRWSISPYNAAFFPDKHDALKVARKVDGSIKWFNPITGDVN